MSTKRNKEIARRLQEQAPAGLPAAEGEEYVEPGEDLSKNDAATDKVERTMQAKEAHDPTLQKKESGVTEPSFLQAEDIPLGLTKGLAKVGAIVGADALKKVMPLMIKRYALKDAYDAAEGAAKKAAYNTYFDVHKEVEKLVSEMSKAGTKTTKEAESRLGEINGELGDIFQDKYLPTLERIYKGKYKIMEDFPSTPAELQHALRTKVDAIIKSRQPQKRRFYRGSAGTPGRIAAGKRTSARHKAARELKAKNEAAE